MSGRHSSLLFLRSLFELDRGYWDVARIVNVEVESAGYARYAGDMSYVRTRVIIYNNQ
jgi:hypothetical protein